MVQLKSIRGGEQCSQRAFRGHTIFHQQYVGKITTLLPPSIEEVLLHICVLFIGPKKLQDDWIRQHAKPLLVRANTVRKALIWLKQNNVEGTATAHRLDRIAGTRMWVHVTS